MLKSILQKWRSKPKGDRALFQEIKRCHPRRIVELGVANGIRSTAILKSASKFHPLFEIDFTGIDLFEGRPAGESGMPLKQAYQLLSPLCGKVNLFPGDPLSALARFANGMTNTDLLVIAADQDEASLELAWFYVPRMLHAESVVMIETLPEGKETPCFHRLTLLEIEQRANKAAPTRRAKAA